MNLKTWLKNLMIKVGLHKTKKKSPILKEVLDNPENIKLEAYIENDEIIVKIRKKEKKYL